MTDDLFARGPFPVGVRTTAVVDARRDDRQLDVEVWYPAARRYGGLDVSPVTQDAFTVMPGTIALRQAAVRDAAAEPGHYPLVLFSHPSQGHRRESSFLCTHLASHGFVVATADHAGNTLMDSANRVEAGHVWTRDSLAAYVDRIIADRVPDIRALADHLLAAAGEVSDLIDPRRMGLVGWSLGGWAVLATPESDDRFGAIVAMAPAGNSRPLPGIIPATLSFTWSRDIPTLYLAAGRDRFTPLEGIAELRDRTPGAARLCVLAQADHDHFGDAFETELCPRAHARLFVTGLALAHLRATLEDDEGARRFLAGDPCAELRARGVDATELRAPG